MAKKGKKSKKTVRRLRWSRIIPFIIAFILIIAVILVVHALIRWDHTNTEIAIDEKYINDDTMTEVENYYGLYPVSLVRRQSDDDGVNNILVIGNDTLAYSKDGESIAHKLSKKLDGEVSVAVFPGTQITSHTPADFKDATDNFDLFWLCFALSFGDFGDMENAINELPDSVNKSVYRSSLDVLKEVDMEKLDYLILCYDAHDYTEGNTFYDENDTEFKTMMYSFYQSLPNMLLVHYPYLQVVVSSPTYCIYYDENGKAHDCETTVLADLTLPNGLTTLRDGCIVTNDFETYEGSASYIDNYYGVKLSSENADKKLLSDGVIPNKEIRSQIADNIITFFNSSVSNYDAEFDPDADSADSDSDTNEESEAGDEEYLDETSDYDLETDINSDSDSDLFE